MKQIVVLPVMETERKKRNIKTLKDNDIRSLVVRQPIEQTAEGQDQEPGMSVDEFMEEFYKIVPRNKGVVTSGQAAQICNLMVRYRRLQHKTVYQAVTIRLKKYNGTLVSLTPEEQEEALGARFTRENLFLLSDILLVDLTRWPTSRRKQLAKPKRSSGRPRVENPKRKPRRTPALEDTLPLQESTAGEPDEERVKEKLKEIKDLMAEGDSLLES